MEFDFELYLIESLKRFVREAIIYSKNVYEQVFDEKKLPAAIAYLQRATAKMTVAESIYYSHYDILERPEAEEIFDLFNEFSDELVESYATNHSQQWTSIHYNKLMERFEDSVFNFENR